MNDKNSMIINNPNHKFGKVEEEELIEEELEEIVNEDNLMLDAIADYKIEFGVKKVNTDTKKFKEFFKKWKSSN